MRSFKEGVQTEKFKNGVVGAPVFRNQGDEEATKEYINIGVVRSKKTKITLE